MHHFKNDESSFGVPQAAQKEHDTDTDRLKPGFTGEKFSFSARYVLECTRASGNLEEKILKWLLG